jgi:hypothetical protein
MNCACLDWKRNIDKLNAPILLQTARSGGSYQYDGEQFRFCPWCGCELYASVFESVSTNGEVKRT